MVWGVKNRIQRSKTQVVLRFDAPILRRWLYHIPMGMFEGFVRSNYFSNTIKNLYNIWSFDLIIILVSPGDIPRFHDDSVGSPHFFMTLTRPSPSWEGIPCRRPVMPQCQKKPASEVRRGYVMALEYTPPQTHKTWYTHLNKLIFWCGKL